MPRPLSAEEVKYWVQKYSHDYAVMEHPLTVTQGQKGAVRKYLCGAWQDQARHECLQWLFDAPEPIGTGALVDCQWLALKRWIGAEQADDAEWYPDPAWREEANRVRWLVVGWDPTIDEIAYNPVSVANVVVDPLDNMPDTESMVEAAVYLGSHIAEIMEVIDEDARFDALVEAVLKDAIEDEPAAEAEPVLGQQSPDHKPEQRIIKTRKREVYTLD